MSAHHVLARAWRPTSFKEVVGQTHVVKALSHAISNNRLHHAYLLTGTRGIGKTTFARIIARCLNCEKGPTSTPCGKCHACKTIPQGQFVDLIEIDAASRTKVEDTREVLESVHYAPSYGRYKIYLIDEVHMFSNHSFNALLKTLEEPPEHVIFILATTDPERLPMTILSRCLQFRLKALSEMEIKNHLEHILKTESTDFEEEALAMLTSAAHGSMRDALSLLDQAIALGEGVVKSDAAASLLGTAPQDQLNRLIQALLAQDIQQTLEVFSALQSLGVNAEALLKQLGQSLCEHFKSTLLPNQNATILEKDHPWLQLSRAQQLGHLQLLYQMCLLAQKDMPWAPNAFLHLEMLLLRMLAFKGMESPQPEALDVPQIEKVTCKTDSLSVKAPAMTKPVQPLDASVWPNVVEQLNLSGMSKALIRQCHFDCIKGNTLVLHMAAEHTGTLQEKHTKAMSDALKALGHDYAIKIEAKEVSAPKAQTKAPEAIKTNPQIEKRKETLDATILRTISLEKEAVPSE